MQTISATATITVVWVMALLGIAFQILYHEKHKLLETFCYLVVGLVPAVVVVDMASGNNNEVYLSILVFLLL